MNTELIEKDFEQSIKDNPSYVFLIGVQQILKDIQDKFLNRGELEIVKL